MKFFLAFLCLFAFTGLMAQAKVPAKAQKLFDQAQLYFERQQFREAEETVSHAIDMHPTYNEARLMRAELLAMRSAIDLAIVDVESVVNGPDSTAFARTLGALANLYREAFRFKDAVGVYERILRTRKVSEETKAGILQRILDLKASEAIVSNPVPFTPVNLGPEVNSEFSEYHPTLTVDGREMIYTVMRPAKGGCIRGDSRMEEDFYMVVKTETGYGRKQPLPAPINTACNEGAGCFSPDGRYFFFAADKGEVTGMDIYMAERINGIWEQPMSLGEPVNSRYWESQPTFSSDGKTLFFVSKRPGGFGQEDIYRSTWLVDGSWSEPVNIGPTINTKGRDFSPSIHADGVTLYFASDGHPGVGGADLFMTRISSDGSFTTPQNLGYPINSTGDERLILVAADGKTAYYASDGMKGFGRFDLYFFDMPQAVRPTAVTWFQGKVRDGATALKARLELIDLTTNTTIASTYADPKTGTFLMPLMTGKPYALHISHPGYLFHSEHIALDQPKAEERNFNLSAIKPSTQIVLRNVFFDTDKADLKPESQAELLRLVKLLQDNPDLVIEVQGHTDNRGAKIHNLTLSTQRAQSVVRFLLQCGIAAQRLQPKGYGDEQPMATNDTEEGRAQNRRTQIRILR